MFAFADIPPFCPVYHCSKIFAFDFVRLVAQECGTNWGPRSRVVDPLSPMTSDIEDGVRVFLRDRERILRQKYEALVPPGMLAHVGIFYGHAVHTFRVFFDTCGNPRGFFSAMVYVARMGILFYQRGVREAPDHAASLIAECLWHYLHRDVPPVFQEFGGYEARQP